MKETVILPNDVSIPRHLTLRTDVTLLKEGHMQGSQMYSLTTNKKIKKVKIERDYDNSTNWENTTHGEVLMYDEKEMKELVVREIQSTTKNMVMMTVGEVHWYLMMFADRRSGDLSLHNSTKKK